MKKKQYFAQNKHLDPKLHKAKYFYTLDEAKIWIDEQGGGTIKKRNYRTMYVLGEPIKIWGEIYEST